MIFELHAWQFGESWAAYIAIDEYCFQTLSKVNFKSTSDPALFPWDVLLVKAAIAERQTVKNLN